MIADAFAFELSLSKPWDETTELFKPLEYEQILLADSAKCLAVETYLQLCGLKYITRERWNAEFMSPTGDVPFIRSDKFLLAGFDGVVDFVSKKGLGLSAADAANQVHLDGLVLMIHRSFGYAEQFLSWCDDDIFNTVTYGRYTAVYPWPLAGVLAYLERRRVLKQLTASSWSAKSLETVFDDVDRCCATLSGYLGRNRFIGGEVPCHVDVLVFAHISSLLCDSSSDRRLLDIVSCYTSLLQLVRAVEDLLKTRTTR